MFDYSSKYCGIVLSLTSCKLQNVRNFITTGLHVLVLSQTCKE